MALRTLVECIVSLGAGHFLLAFGVSASRTSDDKQPRANLQPAEEHYGRDAGKRVFDIDVFHDP
jgi:hypothetical protein